MSAHLPAGGGPFSFRIFRTVSRSSRNSAGFAPITCRAMIEDDACPSAQALTSWAKSLTAPSLTFRSTVTVDPQSFECAVAVASVPVAQRAVRFVAAGGDLVLTVDPQTAAPMLDGRFNVAFADLKLAALPALRHRIILNFEAQAEGIATDDVIRQVVETVKTE